MARFDSRKLIVWSLLTGAVATAAPTVAKAEEPTTAAVHADPGEQPTDLVQVEDDRIYHLDEVRGLRIYDASQRALPRLVGSYPVVGWPLALVVRRGMATLVMGWSDVRTASGSSPGPASVMTVDARDPARPRLIGVTPIEGVIRDARATSSSLHVLSESDAADEVTLTTFPLGSAATVHRARSVRRDGAAPALRALAEGVVLARRQATGQGTRVELLGPDRDGALRELGSIDLRATIGRDHGEITEWLDASAPGRVRVLGCRDLSSCDAGDPLEVTTLDVSRADWPRVTSTRAVPSPDRWLAARFVGSRLYLSARGWLTAPFPSTSLSIVDLDSDGERPPQTERVPGVLWNIVPAGPRVFVVTTQSDGGLAWEKLGLRVLEGGLDGAPSRQEGFVIADGWAGSPAQGTRHGMAVCGALVALPFQAFGPGSPEPRAAVAVFRTTPHGLARLADVPVPAFVQRLVCVRDRLFAMGAEGPLPVGGGSWDQNAPTSSSAAPPETARTVAETEGASSPGRPAPLGAPNP